MLKKTPPIRGPKLLQDAWDKHKTVRQNYAALGLVHTLNPLASGGAEHDPTKSSNLPTTFEHPHSDSSQAASTSPTAHIPRGYGKIIRDSDGNVVRVELGADDQDQAERPADGDEIQGLRDPEMDKQMMTNWVTELGGGRGSGAAIVQSLEKFSSSSSTSGPRYTSSLETLYLSRLVRRHEDVENMARDRRLNPEQRTAGELRRGIRRAGGAGLLLQAAADHR